MSRHFIGVDIGTQSTKAVLVRDDGTVVAQASSAYRVDTPRPLWAEQWPQVWLDAVRVCVADLTTRSGIPPSSIDALCVDSLYGGSGIPVDEACEPVHPCLIWMDRRAQDEVDRVKAEVDVDRLRAITGNGVDSYYGFTKMLWLRDRRPDVWRRTRQFLPPNTYVNLWLTGEVAVDHSSAGNIGGVYDLGERRWSDDALDMLGIPRSMMPDRLVESTAVVGGLLASRARALGLRSGLPVVAGGVDAAVATLAAGASRVGNHVAMIGTSMCWGTIRKSVDARCGLVAMPHVVNSATDLYVFGGAITAGAAVTWFIDELGGGDVASARANGVDPHAALEEEAAKLPPGADGLLFLPYLMGERSPIWDARASGAFVGLGLHHRRAHLYRAVLEGVTYALRHNIDTAAPGEQALDEGLTLVGGASRSRLWCEIVADVTSRPVRTLREDVEASLGAAMLAAIAVGHADAETLARRWSDLVGKASPRPRAASHYDRLYAEYVKLYPALKPTMHALADARSATPSVAAPR